VDLLIVSSFVPEDPGLGNAPFIARDLGMKGMAFNLESACSGSLVALQTATAMVQSGQYRNAVVAISCTYTRHTDERDSLGWTCGDGAAAYVVGEVPEGYGWLGGFTRHTGETCNALYYTIADHEPPERKVQLRSAPSAGKALKISSELSLRTCVDGALKSAGVQLSEIDFFIFNTPLAWYTQFCSRFLGIPIEKTINTYRWYGNTGPVLMPTNLFHAAKAGRIKDGDLVLLYTIGSISSAGAAIMRWKDVPLGEDPQAHRPQGEVPSLAG
jgi:3-oxoacyl-[acyl-carrier-protein] synthase-3